MKMDSKLTSMDVKSVNAIMVSKFLYIHCYGKNVKLYNFIHKSSYSTSSIVQFLKILD